MFKNLTVGKKCVLGFALVLILLVGIAIVSYRGVVNVAEGFNGYSRNASNTNLMGRIQANLLKFRMNAKDYIAKDDQEALKSYNENFAIFQEMVAEGVENIKNPERVAMIRKISDSTLTYKEDFGRVVSLIDNRNKCVNECLNVNGPIIEKQLTEIMLSANESQESDVVFACGNAIRNMLLGRLYVMKYLDTNLKKDADRAREELTCLEAGLEELKGKLQNSDSKAILAKISKARNEYESAFTEVVDSITTRNEIIRGSLDVIGVRVADSVEDIKLSYKKEQEELGGALMASNKQTIAIVVTASVIALITGVFMAVWLTRSITKPISRIVASLTEGSQQVASASVQVSTASQSLAEGATEQAAGLEETSSSLEEMASMTKQNAENAQQAKNLASDTNRVASEGSEAMGRMSTAMSDIQKSSDETAKIIKVIDEIAFQTNLLALNAAVEAARAGEAGKGFAVVAEEVRNLAMRSSEAAKNTSEMIEGAVRNARNGGEIVGEVAEKLNEISTSVSKVDCLIAEIAAASTEQSQGIDQVNIAVTQMDKVTQSNAANAEESASASEELSAQAEQMNDVVNELLEMVQGKSKKANSRVMPRKRISKSDGIYHSIANGCSGKTGSGEVKGGAESAIPFKEDSSKSHFEAFNS